MIKPETIAKIQDEADIVDVLGDFITLKRSGSNYKANCPFHNEKTPSFMVSPAKGIYKCFGCGAAGNPVKFVMEHEQMSYVEALKYLAEKYNIEIEEIKQTDEQLAAQSEKDSLFIVNEFARDTFAHNLFKTEEGRNIGLSYFKERGFTEATIKKFQLGYTLEKSDSFTQLALEKKYNLEVLKKAGLTSSKENSKFDFFRGRVMFPIHSVSGKVLGFGGRILKSNTKFPKYINTPDTDIYDKSSVLYGMHFARNQIRKLDECLLVEGYTDVISMAQEGVENVVASSGTSLTQQQVKLIKRYSENITLLFDGDAAGIKAALRGVDIILENGLNVKIAMLPPEHDPDSFIKEVEKEGFEAFLKENKTDFLIFKSKLLTEEAKNDPVKKAENIQDIVASIAKIPDSIKRSVYLQECSNLMGISEQVLASEINKKRKKSFSEAKKEENRDQNKKDEGTFKEALEDEQFVEAGINLGFFEQNIIRLIIEYANKPYDENVKVVDYLIQELDGVEFSNATHQKIWEIALHHHEVEGFENEQFLSHHQDEEISNLAITFLASPYELSENWKKKKVEIPDTELIYREDVDAGIYYFKFWHIKTQELELMKALKKADIEDFENYKKLLHIKKKLDEDKNTLAQIKGFTIMQK